MSLFPYFNVPERFINLVLIKHFSSCLQNCWREILQVYIQSTLQYVGTFKLYILMLYMYAVSEMMWKWTSQGPEFGQESFHVRLSIGATAAADCSSGGGRLEGRRLCFNLHLFLIRFNRHSLHHPLSVQPVTVTGGVPVPAARLRTRSSLWPGCRRMALRLVTGLLGQGSFHHRRAHIYILPRARPL